MTQEEKRAWAMETLRKRQQELNRQPKKDDFDNVTLSRIKAFLGPWPRALEAAGLKEPRPSVAKKPKRRAAHPKTIPSRREEP